MEKKVICFFTDWYPTSDNPYKGLFFREQALALEEKYDFVVLNYSENINFFPRKLIELSLNNQERNIKEYSLKFNVPIYTMIANKFVNLNKIVLSKFTGTLGEVSVIKHRCILKMIKKLWEKLDKNIDVFYCVDAQKDAYYLKMLSELSSKPYIVSEHAPFPWIGCLIEKKDRDAIEGANAFLAISNDKIRQIMMQNVNLPKTFYIGNLVDEDAFKITSGNGDVKRFIIVAANSFYKNYKMFVKVMNRLVEISNVPFKVCIVGYAANKGYSEDADEFEKMIMQSKFSDRVELIPELPHDKICDELMKSDAFVFTSIQEGQPVAVLEAACCGLPIFSTRCGGVEDYVDDSVGRIYDINDIESFAQGLADYLCGKITFDSKYIREKVVSRFGKEAFVSNFANAVEYVTASE